VGVSPLTSVSVSQPQRADARRSPVWTRGQFGWCL